MASPLLVLLGGLAIFLHGLDQAKSGLQLAAGDRLRPLVAAITRNRVVGAIAGMLVTVVIQSSTAVTLMIVDYCAAGMCSFAEALAVLLGAGVGTTLIVQLITFRLSALALPMVALGVGLRLASASAQPLGRSLIGLGLLFFGLEVMGSGVVPLLQGQAGALALQYLAAHPLASACAAAVLTVLLQGSAPTIGLLLSVASAGTLSLQAALPFVLGANVGTTLTPLLAALQKPLAGRRAAVANVAIKAFGAAAMLLVLGPAAHLLARTAASPARQVANAHSLFNLALAVAGLVLLGPLARLVERYVQPEPGAQPFRPRHLSLEALETPALAFGQASRELLNMAAVVVDMFSGIRGAMLGPGAAACEVIEAEDDKVDMLNREIRFYLARLGSDRMTSAQGQRRMQLINVCSDLEGIGDVITRSLVALARKKAAKGVSFSLEGGKELGELHAQVAHAFDVAVSAFATGDEELGLRARRMIAQIEADDLRLRRSHIERLHRSEKASIESSSIHLDVLTDLARIASLLTAMVEAASRPRGQDPGVA